LSWGASLVRIGQPKNIWKITLNLSNLY
jgi:hypothetical protein